MLREREGRGGRQKRKEQVSKECSARTRHGRRGEEGAAGTGTAAKAAEAKAAEAAEAAPQHHSTTAHHVCQTSAQQRTREVVHPVVVGHCDVEVGIGNGGQRHLDETGGLQNPETKNVGGVEGGRSGQGHEVVPLGRDVQRNVHCARDVLQSAVHNLLPV